MNNFNDEGDWRKKKGWIWRKGGDIEMEEEKRNVSDFFSFSSLLKGNLK